MTLFWLGPITRRLSRPAETHRSSCLACKLRFPLGGSQSPGCGGECPTGKSSGRQWESDYQDHNSYSKVLIEQLFLHFFMLPSDAEPRSLCIPTTGHCSAHHILPLNGILIFHRKVNHTADTSWFVIKTTEDLRNVCLCICTYK